MVEESGRPTKRPVGTGRPGRTGRAAPAYPVPTPQEEERLVRACLDGDAAAWRRLLGRYEAVIHAVPRRFGLDPEDAAEIFQGVSLALFRGLPRLKLAAGLTRWVVTTAWRQSRDLARRRRREVHEPETGTPERPDSAPRVDTLIVEMEERAAIRRAIELLPPRCARLLTWLYLDPEPPAYREIAERLGVPEGTVGPTRARCLQKLRQILEKGAR
jgi:RNA polymerase sigma factor (sigma-70 family)